ncbi:MAG: hypothetical protein ACLQDQ_09585 [Myxococcaceae bacterium]
MRSVLLLLCSAAVAACSHGGVENGFNGFTGTVTGVVVLPQPNASDDSACTQIAIFATASDEKGQNQRVGRPSVHSQNGRCLYSIGELPPTVAVTVHVEAAAGMKCGNGTSLAFAAEGPETVSLKDDQIVTRDFQPQCSATTSLR